MNLNRTFALGIAKLAPVLALTSLLGAGCAGAPAGADEISVDTPDDRTLAEDASYMRKLYVDRSIDAGLGFMRVDLADDRQYQFILHRLLKSGSTKESAPHVFEGLERARAGHLAKPPAQPVVLPGEPVAATSQALAGASCGQFLEAPVASDASVSQSHAKTTLNCVNGSNIWYAYEDVVEWETDAAQSYQNLLDYNYVETYGGVGELVTPTVGGSLPVNVGKFHYVDGTMYLDDGSGNYEILYVSFKNPAVNKTTVISSIHPAKYRNGPTIRSCIKRGAYVGNGDCDYAAVDVNGVPSQSGVGIAKMVSINGVWQADPDPANRWFPIPGFQQMSNIYVPLVGTFDAGTDESNNDCTITGFTQGRSVMSLQTGGWCITSAGAPQSPVKTNILSALQAPGKTGARTASFNVLADFGPDCLPLLSGTANTTEVKIVNTISATTSCGDRPQTQIIEHLDFKDSCFAKGTGILRADGRYVAVEDIKMGDKVIANDHGLALSVVSMTRGGENHPMFRILDDKGHNVLLTELHPVITSEGILPANAVHEGLGLETDSGPATVVAVEEVRYADAVYNLALGTPEQLAKVSADDRTMFAGGIRVGDNEMQLDLAKKSRPLPRRHVAAAFEEDYRNAVARGRNLATVP